MRVLRNDLHPPQPVCPRDHGRELAWEAVSGRATVATFSVNHQAWMPGPELPYVVAIIELTEGARMLGNLVEIDVDQVTCDMPVQVVYDDVTEEVTIPKFKPA